MTHSPLPSLLNAHGLQFNCRRSQLLPGTPSGDASGTISTTYEKYKKQRSVSSLRDPKEILPPLTPKKVVKRKPTWDRSCTRMISTACDTESCADVAFSSWFKRASKLRPSVLQSPRGELKESKLRRHWQTPKATPKARGNTTKASKVPEVTGAVDLKTASPTEGYRQHILQQVKRKVGAMKASQPTSLPDSQPALHALRNEIDSLEPNVQVTNVRPAKFLSRPKGPSYPGARETNGQLHQKTFEPTEESDDGIYDDDSNSSCDSDLAVCTISTESSARQPCA